jgi:hypothetical protein
MFIGIFTKLRQGIFLSKKCITQRFYSRSARREVIPVRAILPKYAAWRRFVAYETSPPAV